MGVGVPPLGSYCIVGYENLKCSPYISLLVCHFRLPLIIWEGEDDAAVVGVGSVKCREIRKIIEGRKLCNQFQ